MRDEPAGELDDAATAADGSDVSEGDDDPYGDGASSDGISEADSLYGVTRAESAEGLGASSSGMESFAESARARALDAAMHPCVAGGSAMAAASGGAPAAAVAVAEAAAAAAAARPKPAPEAASSVREGSSAAAAAAGGSGQLSGSSTAAAAAAAAATSAGDSPLHLHRGRFTTRYRVLSQDQVLAGTVQLCRALADRFELAEGDAALLLRHGGWDLADVEASLSDAARREAVSAAAGARLFAPKRPPFPAEDAAAGELTCEICYGDIESEDQAFALDCGHWFCKVCWADHCAAQCDCGAAGLAATCPAEDCSVALGPSVFLSLTPPAKFALFRTLWLKSVAKGGFATTCTGDKCDLMAAFPVKGVRNVFCQCSACYCFRCGERGHGPCDCTLAAAFTEKENWVKNPDNGRLDEALKGKIKPW